MSETGRLSGLPPEGWHTVTPRIVVHDARRLVEFVTHVFEATGDYRSDRPAVLRIGDSVIMISDAGSREPMPAFLYVYIDDVDRTHRRAIQAGATSLEEPSDLPYGDRRGMVRDEWGNTWQIASPRGNRIHECLLGVPSTRVLSRARRRVAPDAVGKEGPEEDALGDHPS